MTERRGRDGPARCACTTIRRTGRVLTQLYDDALAPTGLRVTQYAVLAKLTGRGPIGMGALADELAMDRTSLTRALTPLQRDGLIRVHADEDRRRRLIRLTEEGEEVLVRARPRWREAQARVTASLGQDRLDALLRELSAVEALIR